MADTPLILDARTGQTVPATDTPEGPIAATPVAAPAAAPLAHDRVPVIVSDGTIQTVAAHELPAALDQGWSVATPEQVAQQRDQDAYGTVQAQARAAGEATLRGLSVGLSDAAMVKLGVDPEGLRKRVEQNPITAGGGEAAGFLAPLLLSGGTAAGAEVAVKGAAEVAAKRGALGLAGDAVRVLGAPVRGLSAAGRAAERVAQHALGESILARGAAQAVSGAVEGGLYGAGQAISESAIQDVPLTGERLVAHIGTGALFGGAAGGVLGTAGAAIEDSLVPTIKKLVNADTVQAYVDKAGLRQFAQGRGKALFTKLRRDFGENAEAVIGRTVREEGLDDAVFSGKNSWADIHGMTQEKLGAAGRRIGDDLREIDRLLPEQAAPAVNKVAERANNEILTPLQRTGLSSDKGLAKKIEREFEGLFPSGEVGADAANVPMNFEQLHKFRQRIDEVAYPKSKLAEPTQYQQQLQKLRGIIEDEITKGADGAAELLAARGEPSIAASYTADKQRWRAMNWLNTAAESNAGSELANRTVSLTDNIWGSTLTAATFARLMAGDVGALGSMVLAAATGAGAGMLNKVLREQGQGQAARMGQKLVRILRANEAVEKETASVVPTFFSSATNALHTSIPVTAARSATPVGMTLASHYEQRKKHIDDFLAAPEQRMASSLGDTEHIAPSVASAVRNTTVQAAQFLQSKMPRTPINQYDAQPLLKKHDSTPDSAKAKFIRYADAVEHPMKVVRDFRDGKISHEGAETLRTVYPRLHAEIANAVMLQLAKTTHKLPRSKLAQISRLLGQPVHPSLSPPFIAACQQVHAANRGNVEQQQSGVSRPLPSHTQDTSSASQRIEASL